MASSLTFLLVLIRYYQPSGFLLLTPLILSQILIMIFMSCCSLHLSVFLSIQNIRGFASAGSVRWSGHAQHLSWLNQQCNRSTMLEHLWHSTTLGCEREDICLHIYYQYPRHGFGIIYSDLDTASSLDFEYFSYGQDLTPFNALLVKNKILICNYIEYAADDIAN